jgi:hypothetical protein
MIKTDEDSSACVFDELCEHLGLDEDELIWGMTSIVMTLNSGRYTISIPPGWPLETSEKRIGDAAAIIADFVSEEFLEDEYEDGLEAARYVTSISKRDIPDMVPCSMPYFSYPEV